MKQIKSGEIVTSRSSGMLSSTVDTRCATCVPHYTGKACHQIAALYGLLAENRFVRLKVENSF